MKRGSLTALSILFIASASAHAVCHYFRTAYRVESCAPTSEMRKDAFADSVDVSTAANLPGLEETPLGPTDYLTCSCDYVLQGSDVRCDQERTQEFSQTYPQDKTSAVCRRGKSLCASLCPKRLP